MRKLHLYIAMSLDGFIARPDGDLDWLSIVHRNDEDYGYHAFVKGTDTVIMGRKTYDKVLSFGIDYPHQDKTSYIITRQTRPSEGNVHFYNGSLKELVEKLKSQEGKDIYCDGGAEIVTELRKNGLIDVYTISIIPVLLGDGLRLFPDGFAEQRLKLIKSKSFESGLVQVSYEL